METGQDNTSNNTLGDPSSQQIDISGASAAQSRSQDRQGSGSTATSQAQRRPSQAGRLHIDTQPPPQHQQQAYTSGGSHAGKSTSAASSTAQLSRRRQWSQTMLDVLQDLSLVLAPDGTIVWAPRTTKALLGFESERLVGESMADFIRPDEVAHFVHHFQESIDQQSDFYHYYHIRKADGEYNCLEVSGRPHYEEVVDPETGGRMHASRCFFITARPHPSRAAQALDTFFDIKKENEVLRQKLMELGVMQEDLSEMGVLGESGIHTQGSAPTSAGPAGMFEEEAQDRSKRSKLQQWQQGSQHSSSPATHQQTAAPFETILAQTRQWQQQQQQQQRQPMQPQTNRASPDVSESFVNAFLSTEDMQSDMSNSAQGPHTLSALHNTASYFYDVGLQSPALTAARPTTGHGDASAGGGRNVQDPRYLSYSGLAQQQQQHVPPSQDFYPFGSPEPFPYGMYSSVGFGDGSAFTAPGVSSQRRTPISMQQQQQSLGQQSMSRPSPRHEQSHLSYAQAASSDTTGMHASRMMTGQSSSSTNSGSRQNDDLRTTYGATGQADQTRAATPTMNHPASSITHTTIHDKSPKKPKKLRAEGPEYVCTDCGTTDSPEWRRGPRGAKTLCNACGLRFAKLQKKASTSAQQSPAMQHAHHQHRSGSMSQSTNSAETRGHARRASGSSATGGK